MTRTPATAFRSILCPVDFSTHSRDALRYAVATAQRFGARATVMFVNDPLLIAAASRSLAGRHDFIHRTRLELERFVNRVAADPSSQDDIALVVTTGNAADEILRTARRLRSDLIVMGTEGLNGFQKLFYGSTTEQVLHRVTIPVLAIPPSKGARPPRKPLMSIDRVMAPLDLAGEWQSDAVRAATVATRSMPNYCWFMSWRGSRRHRGSSQRALRSIAGGSHGPARFSSGSRRSCRRAPALFPACSKGTRLTRFRSLPGARVRSW